MQFVTGELTLFYGSCKIRARTSRHAFRESKDKTSSGNWKNTFRHTSPNTCLYDISNNNYTGKLWWQFSALNAGWARPSTHLVDILIDHKRTHKQLQVHISAYAICNWGDTLRICWQKEVVDFVCLLFFYRVFEMQLFLQTFLARLIFFFPRS